jgi:hypothetical protein
VGFHVLDLLIQIIMLVEQVGEMTISCLEAGDQLTVFGKHANSGNKGQGRQIVHGFNFTLMGDMPPAYCG